MAAEGQGLSKRDYKKDELVVHWDSERCAHSARCVRGNPAVFDLHRRPWVDVDAADADSIVATVRSCPSGALTYSWTDGSGEEEHYEGLEVTAVAGGPFHVRGTLELRDERGRRIPTGQRTALCRCGESATAPLCDGSHRRVGRRPT